MNFSSLIQLKKMTRQLVLFFLVLFGSANTLWSDLEYNRPTGLKPMSEIEIQQMIKSWNQIIEVIPNQIGINRINDYVNHTDLPAVDIPYPATFENEFITIESGKPQTKLKFSQKFTLPESIDNSLLPSFPPIGDQGQESSGVAFATTYYQGTHEIGLTNGYNNKDDRVTILSPKWTYNMINFGRDNGAYAADSYTLMAQNGAPSIVQFPYQAGDYLPWDLDTQHWVDALSNRTSIPNYISSLEDPNSSAITLIKEALNNGHVLTFATFFYNWVYTHIKYDPSDYADNSHVDELACSFVNGNSGGHLITIVGYNDNVWIDVNNNNQVDSGEKGAFLLANSWGSSWGNNGYVWISYDAFYSVTQVPNGPTLKVPAAGAMGNKAVLITSKAPHYTPSLYAQFTVDQIHRNEISLGGGISTTHQTNPAVTFASGAIAYQGGKLRFDGTNSSAPLPGTFVLDLSDLLQTEISDPQRFWLTMSDSRSGSPTIISTYSLVDTVHGRVITKDTDLPLIFDSITANLYIDYQFNDNPGPDMPPTVQFYFPPDGSVVSGYLLITVLATDDHSLSRVEIFVDNYLCGSGTVSPFTAFADTKNLTNGSHTLKAIAYDNANNKTIKTIKIFVNN